MRLPERLVNGLRSVVGDGAGLRRAHPAYWKARRVFRLTSEREVRDSVVALRRRSERWAERTEYGRAHRRGDEWPLLEKQHVRAEARSFVSPGIGVPAATGGSSGVPLALVRSMSSVAVEQAAIDHVLSLAGTDARQARIAILRATDLGLNADGSRRIGRQLGRKRMMLNPYALARDSLNRYVDLVREFSPTVLMTYPSALAHLLELLELNGSRMTFGVVMTSSEVLLPALRRAASRALGARVVDLYGMGERVALAFSIDGAGYTFLPCYGAVELLPVEEGGAPDERLWEVVGSSLWNARMPLMRYRTGDLVVLPSALGQKDVESVCLGLRSFEHIDGRVGDWVRLPNGARAIGMNHIPWGVEHVERMQVLQDPTGAVSILVSATNEYSVIDEDRIIANARSIIGDAVALSVRRHATFVTLPNGKSPFVVRQDESDG